MKKHVLGFVLIGLLVFMVGCSPSVSDEFPKYEQELNKIKEGESYKFVTNEAINDIFKMLLQENAYEQYARTPEFSQFMGRLAGELMVVMTGVNNLTAVVKNEKIQTFNIEFKGLFEFYSDYVIAFTDFEEGAGPMPDLQKFVSEFESRSKMLDGDLTNLKFQ